MMDSKPHPNTSHELKLVGSAPFAQQPGPRGAEARAVRDAGVGSKLSAEFVAQTKPELGIVDTSVHAKFFVRLERELRFGPGLKNELLSDQGVVGRREAPRDLPLVAHKKARLDVEAIGGQPLQAQHCKDSGRVLASLIVPLISQPRLDVEERTDQLPIEHLDVRFAP